MTLELPDLTLAATRLTCHHGSSRRVLLFRLRWSVLRTLGVCASLGLVATLAGAPTS